MPFWKVLESGLRGVTSAGCDGESGWIWGSQSRWGRAREVCMWREGDPGRRAPALVRSLTPGRVWRGAALGCSPRGVVGGAWGPRQRPGLAARRAGERGALNPGAVRGGASSRGWGLVQGRGLIPGAEPRPGARALVPRAEPSPGGVAFPRGGAGGGGRWGGAVAGGAGEARAGLAVRRSRQAGERAAAGGRRASD